MHFNRWIKRKSVCRNALCRISMSLDTFAYRSYLFIGLLIFSEYSSNESRYRRTSNDCMYVVFWSLLARDGGGGGKGGSACRSLEFIHSSFSIISSTYKRILGISFHVIGDSLWIRNKQLVNITSSGFCRRSGRHKLLAPFLLGFIWHSIYFLCNPWIYLL